MRLHVLLPVMAGLCAIPAAAQSMRVPDANKTPGVVDPTVSIADVCTGTRAPHPVPASLCDQVFRAYGIPDTPTARESYACDHLVPLSIGGANDADNLWPQPKAEAALKDKLEDEMQKRACAAYRTLPPSGAARFLLQEQREIASDWRAAFQKYLGAAPGR